MKNNDNKSSIILVIILIICVLGVIYVPDLIKGKGEGMTSLEIIKKDFYKVNEYVPVYVDEEQMSKKYLQDYIDNLVYDMDESYNLLDRDYRNQRFGNIIHYKDYIDNLGLSVNAIVSKYAVYERDGYKVYDVYDDAGNRFIFKTKGVMQYYVIFDDMEVDE